MKLFAWNVNGLRAVIRKGSLESFLDKYHPDILCLGETKISTEQLEAEHIAAKYPDYDQYYSNADRKGYSGTAIWIKKTLLKNPQTITDNTKLLPQTTQDPLNEGRITTIELPNFYLVSVYVPNSKDDLSRLAVRTDWDETFRNYLDKLQSKKPVIAAGDFNVAHTPIDLARPRENTGKHGYTAEERADFTTLLEECRLVDTYRHLHPDTVKYTWWSHWGNARVRDIGWRIDYFLLAHSLAPHLTSADIHGEILGSDHCPVSIEITP